MTALDPATEAYIARLLEQAPPPPPEAVALFARSLGLPRPAWMNLPRAPVQPPPTQPDRTKFPHAVYRHYDSDDVLLYVGMSVTPSRRVNDHKTGAAWWQYRVRETTEWFSDREVTRAAERRAIKDEQPIFNVKDAAPGAALRRRAYLAVQETYIAVRSGQ